MDNYRGTGGKKVAKREQEAELGYQK